MSAENLFGIRNVIFLLEIKWFLIILTQDQHDIGKYMHIFYAY